jgi:ABC-type thiamine transport system ATPase subunit
MPIARVAEIVQNATAHFMGELAYANGQEWRSAQLIAPVRILFKYHNLFSHLSINVDIAKYN